MLGPTIERLARESKGSWRLVKVNVDAHDDLADRFDIRGIPAVKMFRNGQVVAEFTGALPESQVKQWLEEHLSNERIRRA